MADQILMRLEDGERRVYGDPEQPRVEARQRLEGIERRLEVQATAKQRLPPATCHAFEGGDEERAIGPGGIGGARADLSQVGPQALPRVPPALLLDALEAWLERSGVSPTLEPNPFHRPPDPRARGRDEGDPAVRARAADRLR